MLDDYFSLEITPEDEGGPLLRTLPMLSGREDLVPPLSALPLFVLRLATEVAWHEEEACFDTFIRCSFTFSVFLPHSSATVAFVLLLLLLLLLLLFFPGVV